MKRSICLSAFAIFSSCILSLPSAAQVSAGWTASREVEDRLTKGRSEFNYYEEKVPAYTLPDLMTTLSGKKVTTSREWEKGRRGELLEMFRRNVYGRIPSTVYEKKFTVRNEDKNAMSGNATLKQVDIEILSGDKGLTVHLTMFTPNKVSKPAPLFLLIDNRGPSNTDPTRQNRSEFWPAEEVIARGYGIAVFHNSDIDPDNFDFFGNGIHGVLDRGRDAESWGTLAAWAWGASRCLDYLETDRNVDSKRVAVVGHSRGGKTALWAGAEDNRFGMVIANESGCGGAALARRKLGETVARINTSFPHWFCTMYSSYNNRENEMPFDMHMLLALIAPRPLYIDAAAEDLWGDPKGCYLALYHSLPAFRLYNKSTVMPEYVPPLNQQFTSGNVGFHIREGEHNMKLLDWKYFMDFADQVWSK